MVAGEAGGEPTEGQLAAAAVALNRAKISGQPVSAIIAAPGQFDGYNDRTRQLQRGSPEYQRIAATIAPLLSGEAPDPTGGATHFLNEDTVLAERGSLPAWARGQPGQKIGRHTFLRGPFPTRTAMPTPATGSTPSTSTSTFPPYMQGLIGLQNTPPEVSAAETAAKAARDKAAAVLGTDTARYGDIERRAGQPAPDAPTYQDPSAPPKEEPGDPMRVLGQFLPLMAILGGAVSRTHSLAALKAATGAMKAAQTGDANEIALHRQQWLDSMTALKEHNDQQRNRYDDAMKKWDSDRQGAIADLSVLAAGEQNALQQVALADGNVSQVVGQWDMRIKSMESLAQLTTQAQQHDLEARREAETERADRAREAHEGAAIPPATRSYNEAHDRYLAEHPGDEAGASAAANAALHDTELAVKPGLMGTQERAAKASFMREPDVQFYQKAEPYFTTIDDVLAHPSRPQTNAEQLQILDAFTKIATGGQAIRAFMARAGVDSQSYLSQLQTQMSKLTANHGLTLDPAVMLQYANAAKTARDAQMQLYTQKVADDANAAIRNGLDPADIIPTADLDRAVQAGLVHLPSSVAATVNTPPPSPGGGRADLIFNPTTGKLEPAGAH